MLIDRRLLLSPDLYPEGINLQKQQLQLCQMSRESYRESPFLDNRIIRSSEQTQSISFNEIISFDGQLLPLPACFIFHNAFCCSTLLTRFLDSLEQFLVLREPHSLFELASSLRFRGTAFLPPIEPSDWDRIYLFLLCLLTRRYNADQPTVIKPSDGCNNLMHEFLNAHPSNCGIYLYSTIDRFMTSVLKFQHRDEWTRLRARELTLDQYRSEGRIAVDPATLDRAQTAALVWVLHMNAFQKLAHSETGDRIRSLDSQDFLERPGAVVHAITRHFGIAVSDDRIEQAVSSGTQSAHAKSPRESYGLEQREQDYVRSRQQYGREIDAGIEWAHKHFSAVITKSGLPLPLVS